MVLYLDSELEVWEPVELPYQAGPAKAADNSR